ncbi:MAG: hypothetical protein ACYC99_09310 [Candidatus Geothermincolia bacterium]
MREKKAEIEAVPPAPRKKSRVKRALLVVALGALIGYFAGFNLPEEKRSRLGKLMYEGREMWFRIFV